VHVLQSPEDVEEVEFSADGAWSVVQPTSSKDTPEQSQRAAVQGSVEECPIVMSDSSDDDDDEGGQHAAATDGSETSAKGGTALAALAQRMTNGKCHGHDAQAAPEATSHIAAVKVEGL